MEKICNELEKIIYDEQSFNDAVTTLCQDIKSQSAKAIETLKNNFNSEITNDIKSLSTFADEAKFKEFIEDARNSYLSAIKYIPDTEKARINGIYDGLYDTCIGAVRDLQRLFKLPYRLEYDGKRLTANRDEISKAIRPNFKIEISEEERKYYGLVADVVNSLDAMHDFEVKHEFVKFSYDGINQLSKYGYFRKVNPMPFYQKFDEQHFVDALKNGTMGVERDD